MIDTFKNHARSLTSPPEHGFGVVPSDQTALPNATRALYVGVAGDVAVRLVGGDSVTLTNLPSGTLIPLRVTHVLGTGTTATGIVGLW